MAPTVYPLDIEVMMSVWKVEVVLVMSVTTTGYWDQQMERKTKL